MRSYGCSVNYFQVPFLDYHNLNKVLLCAFSLTELVPVWDGLSSLSLQPVKSILHVVKDFPILAVLLIRTLILAVCENALYF